MMFIKVVLSISLVFLSYSMENAEQCIECKQPFEVGVIDDEINADCCIQLPCQHNWHLACLLNLLKSGSNQCTCARKFSLEDLEKDKVKTSGRNLNDNEQAVLFKIRHHYSINEPKTLSEDVYKSALNKIERSTEERSHFDYLYQHGFITDEVDMFDAENIMMLLDQ